MTGEAKITDEFKSSLYRDSFTTEFLFFTQSTLKWMFSRLKSPTEKRCKSFSPTFGVRGTEPF